MPVTRRDELPIHTEEDVVRVRQAVRRWSAELGFSLVDQTKIVTAASELGRNAVIYGGGGEVTLEALDEGGRTGLRLTFEDHGPGIADVELAMRDGYTTGTGLGFGLGGAKRLVQDFEVASEPGHGTRVRIARWR